MESSTPIYICVLRTLRDKSFYSNLFLFPVLHFNDKSYNSPATRAPPRLLLRLPFCWSISASTIRAKNSASAASALLASASSSAESPRLHLWFGWLCSHSAPPLRPTLLLALPPLVWPSSSADSDLPQPPSIRPTLRSFCRRHHCLGRLCCRSSASAFADCAFISASALRLHVRLRWTVSVLLNC